MLVIVLSCLNRIGLSICGDPLPYISHFTESHWSAETQLDGDNPTDYIIYIRNKQGLRCYVHSLAHSHDVLWQYSTDGKSFSNVSMTDYSAPHR